MIQIADFILTPVMDSDPSAGFPNSPDCKTHYKIYRLSASSIEILVSLSCSLRHLCFYRTLQIFLVIRDVVMNTDLGSLVHGNTTVACNSPEVDWRLKLAHAD